MVGNSTSLPPANGSMSSTSGFDDGSASLFVINSFGSFSNANGNGFSFDFKFIDAIDETKFDLKWPPPPPPPPTPLLLVLLDGNCVGGLSSDLLCFILDGNRLSRNDCNVLISFNSNGVRCNTVFKFREKFSWEKTKRKQFQVKMLTESDRNQFWMFKMNYFLFDNPRDLNTNLP